MTRENQVSRHDGASHKVASRQGQAQRMQEVEEYETGTKASAQAGLNLNLFAAVSGVFGSKSKKTTDTAPDGSSHSVEDTHGVGHVKGVGAGNLKAAGSAQATDYQRKTKSVEQRQSQRQEQVESVDHLGIEG